MALLASLRTTRVLRIRRSLRDAISVLAMLRNMEEGEKKVFNSPGKEQISPLSVLAKATMLKRKMK
jgi:hypothetical protein